MNRWHGLRTTARAPSLPPSPLSVFSVRSFFVAAVAHFLRHSSVRFTTNNFCEENNGGGDGGRVKGRKSERAAGPSDRRLPCRHTSSKVFDVDDEFSHFRHCAIAIAPPPFYLEIARFTFTWCIFLFLHVLHLSGEAGAATFRSLSSSASRSSRIQSGRGARVI